MGVKLRELSKTGPDAWLQSAQRTLQTELGGLTELAAAFDGELGLGFCEAVALVRATQGRVILTGIGKSGHIARKIASTMASTGTLSMYVHPVEASHGDLGMITSRDVIIMISNSGETPELRAILDYAKRFAVKIIAMTSRAQSTLSEKADITLLLPAAREACPIGLAPTTSSLLQLALGDALAMALLEDKGFNSAQFKALHPGGLLGAALSHVSDVMHKPPRLPIAAPDMVMSDALVVMTQKSFGCLGVTDAAGRLIGIVTDGDLRRHMSHELVDLPVAEVMTPTPRTIAPDTLASEALEMLNSLKITSLFVIDDGERPVGLVHIHDLLRIGVM
jgi:arabinose-5-phosphate isomerase